MKKYILPLLVCAFLLSLPALAAQNSMSNFVRSKTYTGQFSDLEKTSLYYPYVAALYEYGLTIGKGDGSYGAEDNMQIGEIFIFASRIRSLYRTGNAETGVETYGDTSQFLPHLAYLQAEGVVGSELEGDYRQAATRAQVAHVLAGTLPDDVLPPIHEDSVSQGYALGRYITDVTKATPYQQDILYLYKRGIAVGCDARGSFRPNQPITRAEVSAMIARMVDPSLRVAPDWDLTPASDVKSLGDLVPPTQCGTVVTEVAQLKNCVQAMLSQNSRTMTLRYANANISARFANTVMETCLSLVLEHCEQLYNAATCVYTSDSITLTFHADGVADGDLETIRADTLQQALAVRASLWNTGRLRQDMSELEKAKVYFTWLCENVLYDDSVQANPSSLSHLAYRAFHDGKAACGGYTGAYNLLLKLEGIDCRAQSNPDHMWTVAVLDGTSYHIDTVLGDASPIQYQYFAMTPQQAWEAHSW